MIERIIIASLRERFLVLSLALLLAAAGVYALLRMPLDALPDLSDTQVILRTPWDGQPPRIVEDQLTFPLSSAMMSVPGVASVRGYSSFGDSFVYVIFESGTDLYWARSRVLEALSGIERTLPAGVRPTLGPDATGLGWIYQYALVDRSGQHDLSELRALQDWSLRYSLLSIPDVAEVATVGGMLRGWQIEPRPAALAALEITPAMLMEAVRAANSATGASLVEQGEAELMLRSEGYLRSLSDFEAIPLRTGADGSLVTLSDVATIRRAPVFRRGIAELDGQGEVVGGVVVLRQGRNALAAIRAVEQRIEEIRVSLPDGVEIVTTYDRSELIVAAIRNLATKLVEEFLAVALVCIVFLWHFRSALVAVVALPLGVLAAFVVMQWQGINANLLSLGGIAIAIGAMLDASIVMVENLHRHLEHWQTEHGGPPNDAQRWVLVREACCEVGPALFASLMVITLSFVPVFALEAQEGRLFAPLAFTKTWAMAAAAGLSVTLVPVLMGLLVRGRIRSESANPLNRALIAIYAPLLRAALRHPWTSLILIGALVLSATVPISRLQREFMPMLDEGVLLYMPSALPGLSPGKAAELLQHTDRMIASVPEVARVFGKAGRAESATDPAPLEMFETTVVLKPRSQWRPGLTPATLRAELDAAVRVPGLSNLWVPPIRNRVDMLSTGIKSPIGIKVLGPDVAELQRVAGEIEVLARATPGVSSALAERIGGGRYLDVTVDRLRAARHGLSQSDVHTQLAMLVGGDAFDQVIEGRARFPVSMRWPRDLRTRADQIAELPMITADGSEVALGELAEVSFSTGPGMYRSEGGKLLAIVYVDAADADLAAIVRSLRAQIADSISLPPGTSIEWAGQFQNLERAMERLALIVPLALLIIFLLIQRVFADIALSLMILCSVPLALVGGIWLVWLLGHAVSVATLVGFLALAGVAAEFGVVMLLYLRNALTREFRQQAGDASDTVDARIDAAIFEGAVQRVRPKAMTVAVILAGLAPILLGEGAGSEVMQRIAAPMLGGMLTAPLLSMWLMPVMFRMLMRRRMRESGHGVAQTA